MNKELIGTVTEIPSCFLCAERATNIIKVSDVEMHACDTHKEHLYRLINVIVALITAIGDKENGN